MNSTPYSMPQAPTTLPPLFPGDETAALLTDVMERVQAARIPEWTDSQPTASLFSRALALVQEWRLRAHGRRQLRSMDARLLKDIGLSRADAFRESRRWFWQS